MSANGSGLCREDGSTEGRCANPQATVIPRPNLVDEVLHLHPSELASQLDLVQTTSVEQMRTACLATALHDRSQDLGDLRGHNWLKGHAPMLPWEGLAANWVCVSACRVVVG
ncbi:hypothetical protein [Nocardioides sp. WS12]|uniref:hypothetical protein n=1 Tax=Nocardioides sp. WS12 TaxID=2486272 RepID=UPI0015FD61F7|nr:hypothetical protein [Nocardioides sp. WS12]